LIGKREKPVIREAGSNRKVEIEVEVEVCSKKNEKVEVETVRGSGFEVRE
jgi:primosomal replication protein N